MTRQEVKPLLGMNAELDFQLSRLNQGNGYNTDNNGTNSDKAIFWIPKGGELFFYGGVKPHHIVGKRLLLSVVVYYQLGGIQDNPERML